LSSQTTHAHPLNAHGALQGLDCLGLSGSNASEPTVAHSTTRCGSLVRDPPPEPGLASKPVPFR
jgi:hypothetical protein